MQSLKNNSLADRIFSVCNYVFISLFTVFTVYPFYFCVMLSFNDGKDAARGGIYFWPRAFSLENYSKVFSDPTVLLAAKNTVLRTFLGTVLAVFITAIFAYVISRPNLRLKKLYITLGMITMYFSGGLIPYYLMLRSLGLFNNFLVYIIPNLFGIFNAIIMMSFFRTIPASLEESAKIDGANEFVIFIRIMIPVSTPVLATIALFVGVGQWNSWFDTAMFARDEKLETLSHLLVKMVNTVRYYEQVGDTVKVSANAMSQQRGMTSNALQLATMVVTAFPIIVAYPFLQKYFVKGIMVGSLKG